MEPTIGNYLVDISSLFYSGVTRRAFSIVTEVIGGLDRLIDLSCNLAIEYSTHRDMSIVTDSLRDNWVTSDDGNSSDLVFKVVISLVGLLHVKFLIPLINQNYGKSLFNMMVRHAALVPYDYLTRQGVQDIGVPSLRVNVSCTWV